MCSVFERAEVYAPASTSTPVSVWDVCQCGESASSEHVPIEKQYFLEKSNILSY